MSKSNEAPIWGLHAGRTGDADSMFLERNVIGIGWSKVGDLSLLAPTRDAFKSAVAQAYPEKKAGAIPVSAGQLFRFVHEMKTSDFVAYPSKRDRLIHLGRINGEYSYEPKKEPGYPNTRTVKWLQTIPRTQLTQGALYEIGSALSLFQLKNYAEEFRAAIDGVSAPVVQPSLDETVAMVADEIEETTRDFVIKQLSQKLKGCPLEAFIAHLLECMGYHARLTRINEPSVDVIAYKDHLGIEPPIIKVQVKSGDGAISDKDVSALYGKLSDSEYGLFVTLGTYSSHARNFESSKENLRLIDGEELVELIFQHYEKFDSRHKGLLPLRRVYVPEPIDTDEP